MTDISSLIQRVEGLSGPDRETDARLSAMFVKKGISYGLGDDYGWAPQSLVETWTEEKWAEVGKEVSAYVPSYTASIDAALSLVESMLPGWHICLSRFSDGWYCTLAEHSFDSRQYIWSQAPNGPIAIIAALLRALHQGGENA